MNNEEIKFISGRQINYPDLAWNIHAFVYTYQLQNNDAAIQGLLALDVAYRQVSKTYENFSDKYKAHFAKKQKAA